MYTVQSEVCWLWSAPWAWSIAVVATGGGREGAHMWLEDVLLGAVSDGVNVSME